VVWAGTTMTWQLKPEHDRIVLRPQRLPQPKAGEAMEEKFNNE